MIDLTDVELKTLQMVADGRTNADIASEINYSYNYITSTGGPLNSVYRKLGVRDYPASCTRAVAVARGFREGLLT